MFGQIDLRINLISSTDGLRNTENRFLFSDSENFTWISSTHGLYRFNGKNVDAFFPGHDDPLTMRGFIVNTNFSEDQEHNIWFTTYDAINCYIRKSNSFKSFTRPGNREGGYFAGGLDSLQQLWFLHGDLLVKFNIITHQFHVVTPVRSGVSRLKLRVDSHGKVETAYIYNSERTLPGFDIIEFDNDKPVRTNSFFTRESGQPLVTRTIYIENESSLWIPSHRALYHFNPQGSLLDSFSFAKPGSEVYFNSADRLNDSMLILSTYGKGVYTFNLRKQVFQEHYQLISSNLPVEYPLQTMYVDPHGGVWISISDKGVGYFHPEKNLFTYSRLSLTTSQLTSGIDLNQMIEMPDGRIWGSSGLNGAVLLEDTKTVFTHFNKDVTPNWIANNTKSAFLDSQHRVWTLTANGPCLYYDAKTIQPLVPNKRFSVDNVVEIEKGLFLLNTPLNGLFYCRDSGNGRFDIASVTTIDKRRQFSILYRHANSKIYGLDNLETLCVLSYDKELHVTDTIPFKTYANCIVPMPGGKDLWIGTNNGIYILNTLSNIIDTVPWMNFLLGVEINGIVTETENRIWISTNQGIYCLEPSSETFRQFDLSNGIGTMTFNSNAFLKRNNGEIWFASHDGITVIPPGLKFEEVPLNHINITNILINDLPPQDLACERTRATNIAELQTIRLPYDNNTISFEFVAFDYGGPGHPLYEYRLKGLEDDWVRNEHSNFARYADIKAGDYIFEVRAKNGTDPSYSPTRSLAIHIISPLYQRTWFITLMILVIMAIAYWVVMLNEKRKRRIQQLIFDKKLALESERLRISNDMHDDLGSGLSALQLRTKILAQQVEDPGLKSQIKELESNADNLSQKIRETIWTINSKNDTIDNLVTKLHQYAVDYLEACSISCKVELMLELNLTPIPGTDRRELFLVFKEALHNIYKHSAASFVSIRMSMEGNTLVIEIHDNGHGFDTRHPSPGLGLQSMQKRIGDMGGKLELHSDTKGTRITIRYSL